MSNLQSAPSGSPPPSTPSPATPPGTAEAPSTAPPHRGDVALLIDWENLKWGLREYFRAAPNLSSIIAATREQGRLVTARAYADWTQPQLAIDAPNLYRAGIEPIYAQGRTGADGVVLKNSADVRLAVDAVALCSQLPHVTAYVLVTGDGDLVHPVNHIRLHGHRVVVIAVRAAMSSLLESAADTVMVYERDVEPLESDRAPAPERNRPLEQGLEQLRRWLPFVLSGARIKQSFTSLSEMLQTRFGFNPRDYGKSFKEVMLLAADRKLVTISTEGSMDYAALPGRAVPVAESEEEEENGGTAFTYQGDVRFEHLESDDQRRLLEYIEDVESSSRFLTVTYLVERLSHSSVLPMLAEEQVRGLLLDAIRTGMFTVQEVEAVSGRTGLTFMRKNLHLNRQHPAVRKHVGG